MSDVDFLFTKPQRIIRFDPGDHFQLTFTEKSWKVWRSQFDELESTRKITLEDPNGTQVSFIIVKSL